MGNRVLTAELVQAYGNYLQQEEKAAATIEKYLHDIQTFAGWLGEREVTKELVTAWKNLLLERNLNPSTINAKLSAINGLFRFLGWDGCRVRFLKLQKRAFRDASRDLTRSEYERLLETASGWLELLLQAICATGIRVSEVRYITVEAASAGRADISLKGKIRTILLPQKLCRKLLKFAKQQKIASGEIFLARDGKGLSRHKIWREMKSLCKKAGVEASKVFPHNLRHLFAAMFYKVTRDIVKLADVLGHSSVDTTRVYLLTTGAEHVRQLERLGLVS